jgi:hypothetical protein
MDEDGNWRLAACRHKRGNHFVNLAAMIAQDEHELNYLTRGPARGRWEVLLRSACAIGVNVVSARQASAKCRVEVDSTWRNATWRKRGHEVNKSS